jgi:hypothetical protein
MGLGQAKIARSPVAKTKEKKILGGKMKQVFVVLLGLVMVFGVAASASAELASGHLNLVLYNDTNEVIYDLGWGADPNGGDAYVGAQPVGTVLIDNVDIADFTGFSIYGMYNGIFAQQGITEPRADGNINPSLVNNFWGVMGDVNGANDYGVVHSILDENAFMNRGGGPSYGGMNNVMVEGEGALTGAAWDAEGEEVLHLYQYWMPTTELSYYTSVALVDNGDGTADVRVSAVPVPAAVWLLGSGLLGIVGLRRKNK